MLYDVRDTGKTLEYGVRRSVTNLDLTFHTDGPWLDPRRTWSGSTASTRPRRAGEPLRQPVHRAQRAPRRHPDLVPRLYQPYPWDRQAEHAPDDSKAGAQPVFQYDGRSFVGRFNERLIETRRQPASRSTPRARAGSHARHRGFA